MFTFSAVCLQFFCLFSAQGLSKEGWNNTKNLFAELTILSFIFLLGIWELGNSIHEFCHLAIMGLISDFFLQNTFFITILSLDVSQMELSDSVKKPKKMFRKPVSGTQCGILRIFLSPRFYVKSMFENLEPQKMPYWQFWRV